MPAEWERFWAKVDPAGPCWLWLAGVDPDGYGIFRAEGKSVRAHRWIWEQLVGPIASGMTLDHFCRVHWCVNPDHVEPVPNRVNLLRGYGAPAQNKRKIVCGRGHRFVHRWGQRVCLECRRDASRRFAARRRERAVA